jgi:hypothetical protein
LPQLPGEVVERVAWSRYAIDQEGVRHVREFIDRHFVDMEATTRMF